MANTPKLTKKQLASIRDMYMQYKSVSAIAREYSVSRSAINWHVNTNSWQAERKLAESEILSSFTDAKKSDFIKMTQSAVNIMARSLDNLATRHDPPSITEATRAADILKTLDNILRLDEGSPTDIIENSEKPMDDKELKKKLSADPFSSVNVEEDEGKQDDSKLN
jgi:predicted DNA-binding protein YlxM (UPF0122 family)